MYKHNKAFTLIELLIVTIIMGVFIGVSVPVFKRSFNNLQLSSFSQELQTFVNYLHDRSVVEKKVIYLNIDIENRKYWVSYRGHEERLKVGSIPGQIRVEFEQKQIAFYPDGDIDKVSIKLINSDNNSVVITTKGVYGGVKLQKQ